MRGLLLLFGFLEFFANCSGVSEFPGKKTKGDSGIPSDNYRKRQVQEVLKTPRFERDAYRHYGSGSKSSKGNSRSSSLLPTSPSKAYDAYGYYPSRRPGSKGSSIQDYLQLFDAVQDLPSDFGEMVAESSYGYGGGYGHGKGFIEYVAIILSWLLTLLFFPFVVCTCYKVVREKGCNNSLGLLGVLGLAAYLQSILQSMTPAATTAAPGRKRREVPNVSIEHPEEPTENIINKPTEDEILSTLFPVLSAVAHARDGLIPVNCTFREICAANTYLVKDYGDVGRSVAALLSSEIGKMLIPSEPRRGPVTLRRVNKVAQLGRSGLPCDLLFPVCKELLFLPMYTIPKSARIPKDHPLIIRSGISLITQSV